MSMTPEVSSHSRKRIPRSLHALLIVALLGIGFDFSGMNGREARELHLPLAWVTYFTPVLAVVLYLVVGLILSRTRLGRTAWILAYASGGLAVAAPNWIVATYAQSIPLARWLEPEERAALNVRFPHPLIEGSATSEGIRLRIRRADYNASLVEFLKSIHALRDT